MYYNGTMITLNDIHFFDISVFSLNLLSFMLGMTFAFFNQGFFGKNIGKYIFLYWGGLAAFYFTLYYLSGNPHALQDLVNQAKTLH